MTKITEKNLVIVHRVMMKRIAKGYSAEQLSFLIGKPNDYVTMVEMLKEPVYSIPELKKIAKAVEESNFRAFFPAINQETIVKVQIERIDSPARRTHICAIISAEGKRRLHFMLDEVFETEEVNDYGVIMAQDAISLLIRHGYFFKSRPPLEVFHSINHFLKKVVNPDEIQQALNSFCKIEAELCLKRIKSNKRGYLYAEC
ncbi:hypothetical protein H7F33_15705 [Pedobacter sp. PAMC26386]|nr:hypothetical protein H7F33_15705 [Pedobacter sp. PAMC26386]